MDLIRPWVSQLFLVTWGIGIFYVIGFGIYDLYRLRYHLYLHHRTKYQELRGSSESPGLFDIAPSGGEFEFIYKSGEDFSDTTVGIEGQGPVRACN